MNGTLPAHRFCVAPMIDWTDRHCRYFHRLLTRRSWLYTEMITTGAILHGHRDHLLAFDASEHPVALQLGGSDPHALADSARLAQAYGYDEINLNCGCPSDRVQSGEFGACLMLKPLQVADCVKALQDATSIPVTVKCRTGVDQQDDYSVFRDSIGTLHDAGCRTFIVHARNAWLQGLSPKENREIPPLKYDWVYRLKRELGSGVQIVLNGGIRSLEAAQQHLQHVDGVMLGREAYENPFVLGSVDALFYGEARRELTRESILESFIAYCEQQVASGMRINYLTRHILGLYQGQPGARAFRRYLSEQAHRPGEDASVIRRALLAQQHASEATR